MSNKIRTSILLRHLIFVLVLLQYGNSFADFVTPIGGVAYKDWTIVNYVDLDSGAGVRDYRGGQYAYNGHNAIDFTLANFAKMDAGVDVLAAKAGTVIAVRDGEYDRWSRVNPNPGHQPNYVVIDHGGGVVTEYLHLKRNSLSVSVGQTVSAGQVIGQVGSSGNSTDPHLHFAVYDNGTAVETYLNPNHWWQNPLPYAGDVHGALDYGISQHVPTLEELVERPLDQSYFRQSDGPGQVAYAWTNLFGFHSSDQLNYRFYRPDGSLYASWNWTTDDIRYGWWIAGIGLPDVPDLGEWRVESRRNGETFYSDSFFVSVPEPGSSILIWGALIVFFKRRSR
jgi:murein DD-endopeptidase MepM/ murein hydrolase activator NlpD